MHETVNTVRQFYEFDQSEFFYGSTPAAASMDDIGYIYVPSGCKSGAKSKYTVAGTCSLTKFVQSMKQNVQSNVQNWSVQKRKIIKILVTMHELSKKAKFTKFDVGWDNALDPHYGSLRCSPDVLSGFKGAYF